jgi:hypothetical protein
MNESVTTSMEQSPSRGASMSSANQEFLGSVSLPHSKEPSVPILPYTVRSKKNCVCLCRGHGRVFYVNTCTLTGNILFERIICMS